MSGVLPLSYRNRWWIFCSLKVWILYLKMNYAASQLTKLSFVFKFLVYFVPDNALRVEAKLGRDTKACHSTELLWSCDSY